MNSARRLAMTLPLFFAAAALMGLGSKEDGKPPLFRDQYGMDLQVTAPPAKNAALPLRQVTGIVRLTGSEPVTELVLVSGNDQYHFEAADQEKLKKYQQGRLTVEGGLYQIEITMTNGEKIARTFLRNIKIINEDS